MDIGKLESKDKDAAPAWRDDECLLNCYVSVLASNGSFNYILF